MSRVTSKLQVTVPKAIAEEYGIKPGDEISWMPAGDGIRVETGRQANFPPDLKSRLIHFDEATERQRRRQSRRRRGGRARTRGWTREDLYHRDRAR
jgi:AbrB family looped-hinge helix DNA binding protein